MENETIDRRKLFVLATKIIVGQSMLVGSTLAKSTRERSDGDAGDKEVDNPQPDITHSLLTFGQAAGAIILFNAGLSLNDSDQQSNKNIDNLLNVDDGKIVSFDDLVNTISENRELKVRGQHRIFKSDNGADESFVLTAEIATFDEQENLVNISLIQLSQIPLNRVNQFSIDDSRDNLQAVISVDNILNRIREIPNSRVELVSKNHRLNNDEIETIRLRAASRSIEAIIPV